MILLLTVLIFLINMFLIRVLVKHDVEEIRKGKLENYTNSDLMFIVICIFFSLVPFVSMIVTIMLISNYFKNCYNPNSKTKYTRIMEILFFIKKEKTNDK